MTDDFSQAEIVRTLQRLETGQGRMEAKFDTLTAGFVTREILDIELRGIHKTVEDNRVTCRQDVDEIKGARAPWWSVAAVIISACAVVLPFVVR